VNYLSVENLAKQQGNKPLFRDVSFGIAQGEKMALVAKNGAGKTTLINILTGTESPDVGQVTWRKQLRVGYLGQDPQFPAGATVLEAVLMSDDPVQRALKAYEAAILALETAHLEDNPEIQTARQLDLQTAMDQLDHLGGWDFEGRLKTLLGRLQITRLTQAVETLSGGQRKRVALAQVLLADPDFLLLDEPTNHLDFDMIEWLEQYLAQAHITALLVSHDRYFLDNVCTHLLELTPNAMYRHEGGYEKFLENKAERDVQAGTEQHKAHNLYRKELDWVRRQPKARGTKSKARLEAFEELSERARKRPPADALQLDVKTTKIGGKVLEIKKLRKRFGELVVVDGFTYTFRRGERIGIVGRNGVGKTTFLRILMGEEKADSGKIELGETIVPGYFKQDGLRWKPGQRVLDRVKEIAEVLELSDGSKIRAEDLLRRFQFSFEQQHALVETLSGGEKRRLNLLTVLIKNPNLLILDEPTNDLDLETLYILEEFLQTYPGCLILVTHDRYFLDKLVEHIFVFEGQGMIRDWIGTYSEWRIHAQLQDAEASRQAAEANRQAQRQQQTAQAQAPKAPSQKLSFKEQKEYETLEGRIATIETDMAALSAQLSSGEGNADDLQRWAADYARLQGELDTATERWLELAERAG
jgi:ATP-binding cassette subfamily F protein uup